MKRGFWLFWMVQFLGAFNDILFKTLVSFMGARIMGDVALSSGFIAIAGFLFVLPFLLLSPVAGVLSDKFPKNRIIVWVKAGEVVIMALALLGLYLRSLPLLLVVLFLMASQSAIFSPTKYGIVPELSKDLPMANGLLQMGSFLAIILGSVFGALWAGSDRFVLIAGWVLLICAILGFAVSLFIPALLPAQKEISLGDLREYLGAVRIGFREIANKKGLFWVFWGLTLFWGSANFYQMNMISFGIYDMAWPNWMVSLVLLTTAGGIVVGSLLAGIGSRHRIETGLVPFGALLMAMSMMGFAFSHKVVFAFLYAFLLGVGAGFYTVPLNSYFQKNADFRVRARTIAVLNIATAVSGVIASVLLFLFGRILEVDPSVMFLALGSIWFALAVGILWRLPRAFFRMLAWILMHSVYRLDVFGEENLSSIGEGNGALLVCNHISFIDGIIILAGLRRDVRFVFHKEVCANPIYDFIRRATGSLVLDTSSPKAIARSLRGVVEAVKGGDLVCFFPEGQLSKTGNMMRFNRGVEFLRKQGISQIVPMYIDLMWGSVFTYARHRLRIRRPRRLPYRVILSIGRPIVFESAYDVRIAVEEVGAEAFSHRADAEKKIHHYFIETAKANLFRFCMADLGGKRLNYLQALAGVFILREKLFPEFAHLRRTNELVGVLLPSSTTAALVNGAILMAGKVPVNLNFTLSRDVIMQSIRFAGIRKIITSRTFLKKMRIEEMDGMVFLEDLSIDWFTRLRVILACLFLPVGLLERLFVKGDLYNVDDTATVMFSSGSTGRPKGVCLTHRNISSNVQAIMQIFDLRGSDVMVGILPLFHSFGFTSTMCLPFAAGIGVVYHSNPLDSRGVIRAIKDFRATVLMATPSFLSLYAKKATREDFASLRAIIVGAEKLNRDFAKEFEEKYGVEIYEGYGATELSPIATVNAPGMSKEGSVGLPIPGVVVKIVSVDDGAMLGPNQEGLVLVKGPNVMFGYLNDPDKTMEVIRDGWYHTGDIGYRDEEGYLFIVDRLARFSKIGGEMVPHIKVEEEIKRILSDNSLVCAVTGIKDEEKGERLVVLLAKDVDVDWLWEELNKSGLPKIWIPRKDSFVRVDEIPVLGTGKMDLKRIKEIARERINTVH